MEHLNGASMSDDRLDSCIIHCERMLEEIGDAEIHLNPDASLSALYASIDFLIATLHESQVRREFTASQRKPAHRPRLDIGANQSKFLVQCGLRITEIVRMIAEVCMDNCGRFRLTAIDIKGHKVPQLEI